jgi:hypothetical protein
MAFRPQRLSPAVAGVAIVVGVLGAVVGVVEGDGDEVVLAELVRAESSG